MKAELAYALGHVLGDEQTNPGHNVRGCTMVRPKQLGHANIRVRDLERSEKFYTEVLGLKVNHRRGNIAFLSVREHSHELAIRAMGSEASGPDETRIGTNHFAWQMETFDDLQAMYRHLQEKGVDIQRVRENAFSVGVYFNDPDGNGIEVYYEDLELYRRGVWEGGQFPRKLEEAIPSVSHS
jgi:catechol 2,3-dioxygenase